MGDLLSLQSILFLFFVSSLSFYLLFFRPKSKSSNTTPYTLTSYPLLGHLPHFLKNRHRFHDWITDALAATPTYTLTFRRLGGVPGIITANPANVEHIIRSRFDNYPKGLRFTSILEDFFGRGIFNTDGHLWRAQRKIASFEFNTNSFRNFVVDTVRHETHSRLLPLLEKTAIDGCAVDIQDVLERFAFDNICKVAFGVDTACLAGDGGDGGGVQRLSSGFAQAFRDATDLSAGRFRYAVQGFWKVKRLLGVGSERRLKESIATVHDFALQIIQSRKKEIRSSSSSSSPPKDFLSRFIASEDNSDEFLRDIVISFILAGRETTSSALTWFFWLLSSRPEVERRILGEIGSIRGRSSSGGGEAFHFEELREMHYLHAAISEAMRLYPPAPANSMTCWEDDVLPDGTVVKKGWFVSYNSYAMGRMEGVWGADCREYQPERWLDGGGAFRPESPFRFPAFHGGPRMCLGKEMAYIQMKSIAASVIERFEMEVVGMRDAPPEKMLSLTLRMKGGLPVRVKDKRAARIG